MDKKKIISSLALAGILTASVLGANVNASTANEYLKPVGVYKKLIEGRTVVPYVLQNADTAVTVKNVRAEFTNLELVNGTAVADDNYKLKTGDTFRADGVEYTVIVYGEVNGDEEGKVTTRDALLIQQFALKNEIPNAFQSEAADVLNDDEISTLDALRVQQFALGNLTSEEFVSILPEAEESDEEDSIYSVSINDNGFINTENVTSSALKVSLDQTFDEEKTLTVKTKGINKISGEEKEETKTIVIPAHTDYIETNKFTSPVTFDFDEYADGKIEIQLLDGATVVATVNTEKNTVVPTATNVLTNRTSTKSATLSLEACGKSDIVKVYYLVKSAVGEPAETELVNQISVSGNSISNKTISNELETDTSYTVYYILENSYGSKSNINSVIITSDAASVVEGEKVEEVIAPDLTKNETEYTWTGVEGKTYVATLYKDGKAIYVEEVSEDSGTDFTVDFTDYMSEQGTYKVAVYAKATADKTASKVTESTEVTVTKLVSVTGLEFINEDGQVILSWENSNELDNFNGYKVELVTINENGEESNPEEVTVSSKEDKEVTVTTQIDPNTIYKAKVTVLANENQLAILNSDETVSEEFYRVGTPSIVSAETSEHEVTLTATGINIPGKTATYKIKIYDVNESGNPEEAELNLIDTRNVEIKDGKIVVDGLETNSPYKFKLVANVDGKEVESDYTENTVRTLPELKDLTVVATEDEAKESGKVYYKTTNVIVVAGTTIDLSSYNNSEKLENSMDIINALEPGDIVSIEDEKVTLKLDGGASATLANRDLSDVDLEDVIIEIESNNYSKTIEISTAKEVILKGTNSIFDLTNVNADKITLIDGVEVVGKKVYTISANSSVIIDGAIITTKLETVVNASTDLVESDMDVLTVTVNEESNDLVFENKKDTKLTINFEGLPNNTSAQSGSIVIKSNGGKVTVTSDKANVSADLTVEVNSGDVDITEPSLTGDKNVTVSLAEGESTTINAISKTKAPVALDNISVDITDEDLLKETGITEDNLAEVKAYIASFNLNGTGATITATKDSKEVTVKFTNVTKDINVAINNIN